MEPREACWEETLLIVAHVYWVFAMGQGFPCGSASKESPCNMEDLASIPGLVRHYDLIINVKGQRNYCVGCPAD